MAMFRKARGAALDQQAPAGTRARAARQLGLTLEASDEDARAAFLWQVAAADFAPPPQTRLAWEIWRGGAPAAASQAAGLEFDRELEAAEREHAEQFFALPVPARRAAFEHYQTRVADDARRLARLKRLEPGLSVDAASLAACGSDAPVGSLANRLGAACLELFVTMPTARAFRRRELLSELTSDARLWKRARRRLRKRAPGIARLAPDFLNGAVRKRSLLDRALTQARRSLHAEINLALPRLSGRANLLWMIVPALLGAIIACVGYVPPRVPTSPVKFKLDAATLEEMKHSEVGRRLLGLPPLKVPPNTKPASEVTPVDRGENRVNEAVVAPEPHAPVAPVRRGEAAQRGPAADSDETRGGTAP